MSDLFASRWVEWPAHVVPGDDKLPQGFRAGGIAAGLKASGRADLAVLVCDEASSTSAIRQTRSSAAAAPVLVNRELVNPGAIRAIVANSGNANAATGEEGFENAVQMRDHTAAALGIARDSTAVCSTGVIGKQLNIDAVCAGIESVVPVLSNDGRASLSEAILTTDKGEKVVSVDIELPGGTVKMTAQAKGAGMIQPAFATMFCFVQTDAVVSEETCDLLLGTVVKRSFERISVDGQLSTNDVVILMASGASGVAVEPQTAAEALFGQALDTVLRSLALMIVADGEGSARVGRLVVEGGEDQTVEHVARTVAGSPLVKSALHGGDPNWGRIIQAVGMALPDSSRIPVDIEIEGTLVCSAGTAVPYDEGALAKAVAGDEVEYLVRIPGTGSVSEVFFSDLSHEYVTINSEYTT